MKLLRCYIENYGKLHEFSYDFDAKMNTILQENGWGKTTFCSFIKAMLFGLPTSTKKDLDENERLKYTPWQSGNFGGWLEFELQGQNYRVERFWGEKQSKDKFRLVNLATNQEVAPNLIEDTLKINAETFERSVFVPHNFSTKIKNDSIKDRLRKLLDNIESESINKIDDRLKEMQTNIEHQKGKGGKLWEATQRQDNLESEIKACEDAKTQTQKLYTELEENNKKIADINTALTEKRKQIDHFNELQVAKERYKSIKQSIDEVENLKKELNAINDFFKNALPDENTVNQLNKTYNEIKSIENTLASLQNNSTEQNLTKLKEYFHTGVPTDEEMEAIKQKNAKYNEAIASKPTPTQTINKLSKKKLLLLCGDCVAIILALIGILGLIITQKPVIFTPITILGVLLGIVSFYFTFHTPETEITPIQTAESSKMRDTQERFCAEISSFIDRFEPNAKDFTQALISIETKRQLLKQYNQDSTSQNDQTKDLERRLKLNQDFLNNYLSNFYSEPIIYTQNLADLTKKLQKYEILKEQLETKQANLAPLPEQAPEMDIDIDKIRAEENKLEHEKEQLTQQNAQTTSKIDALLTQASAITGLRFRLDETKEEITKLRHDLTIIQNTREFLLMANTNLTSKYLSPITSSFKKYSQSIVGNLFDNIAIDTDLNITLENYGEQKQAKFYSLGNRDVIELCMRFALAETLFGDENPPMILDDTFSNLDDKKTQKALELIEKVTDKFQIIYLVCHSSRTKKG